MLTQGPAHLIPSLKFRLPYLINVHQSIDPFLLKSRGMQYYPSGKTPTSLCLWQFKLQFYHAFAMLTTFISSFILLVLWLSGKTE